MNLAEIISLTELEEVVEALTAERDEPEYWYEQDPDDWQLAQDRYDREVYGE